MKTRVLTFPKDTLKERSIFKGLTLEVVKSRVSSFVKLAGFSVEFVVVTAYYGHLTSF